MTISSSREWEMLVSKGGWSLIIPHGVQYVRFFLARKLNNFFRLIDADGDGTLDLCGAGYRHEDRAGRTWKIHINNNTKKPIWLG